MQRRVQSRLGLSRETFSPYTFHQLEEIIKSRLGKNLSRLFEESGILEKHDFKGGKARYEQSPDEHHDHLIDINSGEIIEFVDEEIEKLQIAVAKKLGYKLVDHKLELYGSKIKK